VAPGRRYDLYGDAFERDPHATFVAMRREAPIHKQAGLDGETWCSGDASALARSRATIATP